MIPRAFVGAAEGGGIYALEEGESDAGAPVRVAAETAAVAPGGVGASHCFEWLRIVLTHTMATTLTITPIIDGILLVEAAFDILLEAQAQRTSRVFERLVRVPVMRGGAEIRRYAPVGTWVAVRIEADAIAAGELILDAIDAEIEVLTPSKERV